jgi:hypothetical protein
MKTPVTRVVAVRPRLGTCTVYIDHPPGGFHRLVPQY